MILSIESINFRIKQYHPTMVTLPSITAHQIHKLFRKKLNKIIYQYYSLLLKLNSNGHGMYSINFKKISLHKK